MRIGAAIVGQLDEYMRSETRAATTGVQNAMKTGGKLLKGKLRRETVTTFKRRVRKGGFKGNLDKTWQDRFYINGGMDAASFVYSKAPQIIEAHIQGAVIRPKGGKRWLAIPTEAAPQRGRRRRERATPENWDEDRWGKLIYIKPKRGRPPLLVVELRRTKKGHLTTKTLKQTVKQRGRKGPFVRRNTGEVTVVMFILKKVVKLEKRFEIAKPVRRVADLLPGLILREYRDRPLRSQGILKG